MSALTINNSMSTYSDNATVVKNIMRAHATSNRRNGSLRFINVNKVTISNFIVVTINYNIAILYRSAIVYIIMLCDISSINILSFLVTSSFLCLASNATE